MIIGLYKTEVIRTRGPWKTINDVEYATLEWVDWFNNRRLLAPIGHAPPAEYEQMYYDDENNRSCKAACLKLTSLRETRGGSYRHLRHRHLHSMTSG